MVKKLIYLYGDEWVKHLFPAEKLVNGSKVYYYSLAKALPTFQIDKEKQIAFKDFLETMWPPK